MWPQKGCSSLKTRLIHSRYAVVSNNRFHHQDNLDFVKYLINIYLLEGPGTQIQFFEIFSKSKHFRTCYTNINFPRDFRSSLIYNTSVRHECNTNATRVLHEWHECDTSATRTTQVRHEWKILILIMTRVKTYFHTPTFTIRQVKDYKERNSLILRTTFWECLAPMSKCVWKMLHKNWTF